MAIEPVGGWGRGDDPLAPPQRWVAAERVRHARDDRVRHASLRHQAATAGRLRGVLLDLAERGDQVELTLRSGAEHGTVTEVGEDFCKLHRQGEVVLVAIAGIGQIGADVDLSFGFRSVGRVAALADVLAELSQGRPVVRVQSAVGPSRAGRLERAGQDVVTIRIDHPMPQSVSINLAVVDAVTLTA